VEANKAANDDSIIMILLLAAFVHWRKQEETALRCDACFQSADTVVMNLNTMVVSNDFEFQTAVHLIPALLILKCSHESSCLSSIQRKRN
jgi:hypothetical protein